MATRTRKRPTSLQLFEFTDDEFLMMIRDNGDNDGWISTDELADAIGLRGDDRNRNTGSRLAWMRRYGTVERDLQPGSSTRGSWRLTSVGEFLINSNLKAAQLRILAEVDDGQLWELTRLVSDLLPQTSLEAAYMIRRQFRVAVNRRRF